jgi:hypothetical protein
MTTAKRRPAGAWKERVAGALWENPVLVKEFRTRMRGTRAYWILFAYTLLIASILAFVYHLFFSSLAGDGYGSAARRAGELGRVMYGVVFVSQAIMVALITPALTAGTITIEREQRSYELLATTPLRPADVIRGKLSAAVSFAVLLLTSTLPLVSLCFLVGGVSPAEIACSYVVVACAAFCYGAVGVFWSATLKATAAATVAAYVTVFGSFLATVVPGVIAQERAWMGSGSGAAPDIPFQSLNPLMAAFRGVQPEHWFGVLAPTWLSASILLVLTGMLAAQQAMTRLEHFPAPRPGWARACATLLWAAFSFSLLAPILGGVTAAGLPPRTLPVRLEEATSVLVVIGGLLLALLSAVLNTCEPAARPRSAAEYLVSLLPHRAFDRGLGSGLPLLLGWGLLFLAIPPLGLLLSG